MPQKTSDTPEQKNMPKNYDALYRTLVEMYPDAITITDLQGNIVLANRRALEVHGCNNPEELIGKNAFDFIAPQDRERSIENAKITLQTGTVKNIEYKLLKRDGTPFNAEITASVLRDSNGTPESFIGIIRDIHERKQIEVALRESEEFYRTLIETSPDSIAMVDLNGNFIMVNQGTITLHGYDAKDEMIGKSAFNLGVPKEKVRALNDMQQVSREGTVRGVEYTLRRKDGTTFSCDANISVIRDALGNPQAFIVYARDITERKKIERALADEKESLAVTLRSIADAVITVNTEGKIVLLNEVAEKLTGWKHQDAVGLNLGDVLQISDSENRKIDCYTMITKVLEKGELAIVINEGVLIAKNEMEKIITQSCAPIRDRDDNVIGVVLVIRDITEKQKMEKELFKARKLESIGILAGGIAHDFNNILTGITSNLFMAKMGLSKDSVPYTSILEAEKAAFRATKLTSQLITFAKGGAPIKESQSIKDIIEEAVGFSLSGSKAECELYLPDNLWTLEIDRGQIDQVITNLLINADQAMPKGGKIVVSAENTLIKDEITEDTTSYLGLKPGKYVKITVKDEGIGIRPEEIEKIYDPYYSTKETGTGLGLTICYSIIRKHNGTINVKSRLGAGTTFAVYLPASEKKKDSVKGRAPLKGSGKILVMDDEEVIRIAAGHVLRRIGYEVDFAKDGSEAIDKYQKAFADKSPFDAIIMDLTVPGGMGGKETIKKLRHIDPQVVAIVSSGYSNDPIMAKYKEYGFSGAITKPYLIEELNAVLMKSIEEKTKKH